MTLKLEVGDIILYKYNTTFSKFIRLANKIKYGGGDYTHAGILIVNGYSNVVGEAMRKGFSVSAYGSYLQTLIDNDKVDIFRLKKGLTDKQKKEIYNFCISHKGTPYDNLGVVKIAINLITGGLVFNNSTTDMICSEAIDKAYLKINTDLREDIPTEYLLPQGIALSRKLRCLTK